MSNAALILAVANVFQTVALAWILAWQQRAAHEVRRLNGTVEDQLAAIRNGVRHLDV